MHEDKETTLSFLSYSVGGSGYETRLEERLSVCKSLVTVQRWCFFTHTRSFVIVMRCGGMVLFV